jgi:hypothetical protein
VAPPFAPSPPLLLWALLVSLCATTETRADCASDIAAALTHAYTTSPREEHYTNESQFPRETPSRIVHLRRIALPDRLHVQVLAAPPSKLVSIWVEEIRVGERWWGRGQGKTEWTSQAIAPAADGDQPRADVDELSKMIASITNASCVSKNNRNGKKTISATFSTQPDNLHCANTLSIEPVSLRPITWSTVSHYKSYGLISTTRTNYRFDPTITVKPPKVSR